MHMPSFRIGGLWENWTETQCWLLLTCLSDAVLTVTSCLSDTQYRLLLTTCLSDAQCWLFQYVWHTMLTVTTRLMHSAITHNVSVWHTVLTVTTCLTHSADCYNMSDAQCYYSQCVCMTHSADCYSPVTTCPRHNADCATCLSDTLTWRLTF